MGNKTFNTSHIERIHNNDLRASIQLLWLWKAKKGIKIVQRLINDAGGNLKVDGWFGSKSVQAINSIDPLEISIPLLNKIDRFEETADPYHVTIAKAELGVKETKGHKHNKRVVEYHSTSTGKYKNDEIPWCGSFVNWVMLQSGITKTVKYPERAKAWKDFGTVIYEPTLGSIAIKNRRGGGHVCFVVGESKNSKSLYCLGGNQGDAVTIKKYKKSAFTDFRLPPGQDKIALNTYSGNSISSTSEA